jgi:predicted TIM-barrel fold metal-dependent hydrolase
VRIDVHAHYYPRSYLDKVDKLGADLSVVTPMPLASEAQEDLDGRLAMMDRAGVAMQVLSVSATQPYFDNEGDAVDAARRANDLYAELVARYPRRFAAFACVPLPHVDAAVRELERALDQLGMVGATIGTSVKERSAADEAFEPFYAELNRRRAPLFVHPAGLALCSPLLRDHGLTWVVGAPFEDTMFVLHSIRRGIPTRYPEIKIIVPHLGGALNALRERIERTTPMFAPAATESTRATMRRFWYDTVAQGNTAALRLARDVFGADRLVYGSDYPYQLHDEYQGSVDYVIESGLPPKEIEIDRNAQQLLGIKN